MKTFKNLGLFAVVGVLLCGCAATPPAGRVSRHFHESKTANVVLQFSSWEYTFLLRPRYEDNGFLLQVPQEKVGQIMNQLGVVKRDLAVVVLGWNHTPEQLEKLVAGWKTILGGCGFQRVVMLKSSGGKQLDGSLVLDDSTLSGGTPPSLTQL